MLVRMRLREASESGALTIRNSSDVALAGNETSDWEFGLDKRRVGGPGLESSCVQVEIRFVPFQ